MPISVNCTQVHETICCHPARRHLKFFGLPSCIEVLPSDDPALRGCACHIKLPAARPVRMLGRVVEGPIPPEKPNEPV